MDERWCPIADSGAYVSSLIARRKLNRAVKRVENGNRYSNFSDWLRVVAFSFLVPRNYGRREINEVVRAFQKFWFTVVFRVSQPSMEPCRRLLPLSPHVEIFPINKSELSILLITDDRRCHDLEQPHSLDDTVPAKQMPMAEPGSLNWQIFIAEWVEILRVGKR